MGLTQSRVICEFYHQDCFKISSHNKNTASHIDSNCVVIIFSKRLNLALQGTASLRKN